MIDTNYGMAFATSGEEIGKKNKKGGKHATNVRKPDTIDRRIS